MKYLKSLIAALILIIASYAFTGNSYASNEGFGFRIYAPVVTTGIIKPRPGYFWVDGHYKVNRYGKMVWVPAHLKRI